MGFFLRVRRNAVNSQKIGHCDSHLVQTRLRCSNEYDVNAQTAMSDIEFPLDRDHVELHHLLKLSGLCDSGGMGKAIVASGAVTVDGVVELRKTCKIRAGQVVRLGDVVIRVVAAS